MTAAEVPRTTTAADDRRAKISAAVRRVDVIQIDADMGRMLLCWLGSYAKLVEQRNGCLPDGLADAIYALAEACAARTDSHGASVDAVLPQLVSNLVTVQAAADLLGVRPTTVRYHYKTGSLSGTKTGTALMIDTTSLAEFRAKREEGTTV